MAGKPKAARVKKWNNDYYLFYFDYKNGKPVRKRCTNLGAFNYVQRKELEAAYRKRAIQEQSDIARAGGIIDGATGLIYDLNLYKDDIEARANERTVNPDAGLGVSETTVVLTERHTEHFKSWLQSNGLEYLKTKNLSKKHLKDYIRFVIGEIRVSKKTRKKSAPRSAATVNKYIRYLKATIRWIGHQDRPQIADLNSLVFELKPRRGITRSNSGAFTPDELIAFAEMAIGRESDLCQQYIGTPVWKVFMMVTLTGARIGEILNLRWEDVDSDCRRMTIFGRKVNRYRTVILSGAVEGEVAPRLVQLLRLWREEEKREYVLPHPGLPTPVYPKNAWRKVLNDLRLDVRREIGPQRLRSNFTSYAASLSVPPAISAMWQGIVQL